MPGQIRVGRITYKDGDKILPSYPEYENILVLTKSSPYGELGPYVLKNNKGQIMENIWQFSKLYEKVPRSIQRYSQYDSKIIWDHPEEVHYLNEEVTDEYWAWREKGFNCKYPVRYPVGFKNRHKCICSLGEREDGDFDMLDYIEARKRIYLPVYTELVKNEKKFHKLKRMLKTHNLLIVEVDGPHQESLEYYKKKYGVEDNFIDRDSIHVTRENMDIMLNDEKHPFGHGYCLAMALLDMTV